jgi:hypothetical protein
MRLNTKTIIAILITDPQITHIFQQGRILHLEAETRQYPPLESIESIPSDIHLWGSLTPPTITLPFFDAMIQTYKGKAHEVNSNPISCTLKCRKMAVACVIGFLRRRYLHLASASSSRSSWLERRDWTSVCDIEVIESLINAKSGLEQVRFEALNNMKLLRIKQTTIESPFADEVTWERVGWQEVLDWLDLLQKMLDTFSRTVTEQTAFRETKRSNATAISIGRLTMLGE